MILPASSSSHSSAGCSGSLVSFRILFHDLSQLQEKILCDIAIPQHMERNGPGEVTRDCLEGEEVLILCDERGSPRAVAQSSCSSLYPALCVYSFVKKVDLILSILI